jgi:hypothetical protein
MLVTDLAFRDMESRSGGLANRLGRILRRLVGRSGVPGIDEVASPFLPELQGHLHLVIAHSTDGCEDDASAVEPTGEFRWRRHPQLRLQSGDETPFDMEDLERGARSAGVRGLFLARSGRIDEARTAFAIAASSADADLTAIPGFWDLPRAGMLAAVGAYEDVERYREAAALAARIRLKYRPRAVMPAGTASPPRRSASGT